MPAFPRYFFLFPTSGTGFEVNDPLRWCLANADNPALERARDLLREADPEADPERLLAAVLRRCKLVLVRWLWPTRVVVNFWSNAQTPNLHPWIVEHGLGRDDVEVSLACVKHDTITAKRGSDFLQGEPMPPQFPLVRYRAAFERKDSDEPLPGTACANTSYCWAGHPDGCIPWEVLRFAWRRESVKCANCSGPLCLYRIDFVRCGFTNWCGREGRVCFECRRVFSASPPGYPHALRDLPPELRPTEWTGFGWRPRVSLDRPGPIGRPREWDTAEELIQPIVVVATANP